MKKINFIKYGLFASVLTLGFSCSNLDEKVLDGTTLDKADPNAILTSAYNGLRSIENQDGVYAIDEISADSMLLPTRGGDWGDGGNWLIDHSHTWTPTSREINTCWNNTLSGVYSCDLALGIAGLSSEKTAEALFLKSYYYYIAIDFFGQVPYRPAGSSPDAYPLVWTSAQATEQVITWLQTALPNLPEKTDASFANKDAARFLLAKLFLNKAVFESPTHVAGSFNAADMTQVVTYVDQITAAGKSTLAPDYWDNFVPTNNNSAEIIFSSKNIRGVSMGPIRARWYAGAHYNQTPSGWNGYAVMADYYASFDPADRRIKNNDASVIAAFGNPMGMQIGQQYAPGGTIALISRAQNGSLPLVFTANTIPDSQTIVNTPDIETAGIRPQKYVPDSANIDAPENDYVFFRYADALLMKAEAIARGGSGSLGTIATQLHSRPGITSPIDLTTLAGINLERAHELWGEGWRRNDMIRFGTYNNDRLGMHNTDTYRYILPIPAAALTNPNITQNPGY